MTDSVEPSPPLPGDLEDQPGDKNEVAVWTGEAFWVTLTENDYQYRGLVARPFLPGVDVHPDVQAAAELVRLREAERAQQQAELDARGPAREQLKQQLKEEGRTAGPARSQAARVLSEFDAETELVAAFIPDADQAVQDARDGLVAAVYASGPAWDEYLDAQGLAEAYALLEDLQPVLRRLKRLERIDSLKSREQILDSRPHTPAEIEANNKRASRKQWLQRLINGDKEGKDPLGALPYVYGDLFGTRPEPWVITAE